MYIMDTRRIRKRMQSLLRKTSINIALWNLFENAFRRDFYVPEELPLDMFFEEVKDGWPEIAENKKASDLFISAMEADQKAYDDIAEVLKEKHLKTFLGEGLDEKTANRMAEKKAIEDARFVLPNACETKIVVTMNARTLMNFFHHRCCNRAQWEIKAVADLMLKEVSKVAPNLFKNAGPSCISGACPEGKMTCGRMKEMREIYEEMKKNG